MARIEWARLTGDDVEHVIAVMVARENVLARRIRPSRGDRGLDIVVPNTDVGSVDVYQVKSFALNLGSSEKRQITKSFRRLRDHAAKTGLSVANWYLVLPLDPTPENIAWFDDLTTGAGFGVAWRGLIYVDGLAARYPDVIDYYLRDGKARLEAAVADLTSILRTGLRMTPGVSDTPGPLTAHEIRTGLLALHAELNRYDPHYRYDFSVDAVPPEVPDQPWLVFAAQLSDDRACVTFKVFARYTESTEDRPVPLGVHWKLVPDSDTARQLTDWATDGTPFEAPLGSADIKADLPGGFGGDFAGAAVKLGPTETGQPYKLRVQVIAPSGEILASCRLNMNRVTIGLDHAGSRASGVEEHGVFSLELRFETETQTAAMSLSSLDITGSRPAQVIPALQFLATFRPPNVLRFALPYGPVSHGGMPIPDGLPDSSEANILLQIVEALTTIQEYTPAQITVPDLTAITQTEARDLISAARLLRGETVTGRWEKLRVRVDPATLAAGEPAVTVMWHEPLTVMINGVEIDLGLRQVQLEAVKVTVDVTAKPDKDGLLPADFRPHAGNQRVLIRRTQEAP